MHRIIRLLSLAAHDRRERQGNDIDYDIIEDTLRVSPDQARGRELTKKPHRQAQFSSATIPIGARPIEEDCAQVRTKQKQDCAVKNEACVVRDVSVSSVFHSFQIHACLI